MKSFSKTLGIIGVGNMGSALLGGFIAKDLSPQNIWTYDHDLEKCAQAQNQWSIQIAADLKTLAQNCEILIFAVKPQTIQSVCTTLSADLRANHFVISIAAGIKTTQIHRWLNAAPCTLIRAMPNLPALIGRGMTALFAPQKSTLAAKQMAETLLNAVGETLWIDDENTMDLVTALSGSGPGYFFYILETMIQAGIQLGLSPSQAKQLVLTTAQGSLQMLNIESDIPQLRAQVTSPGGTTQAGIQALESQHFSQIIQKMIKAAKERATQLSQQYD